jgi:hypothetical protein
VVLMRALSVVFVLFVLGCTKPNPNVCCTDEADCKAAGIPVGSGCEQGLVCRGHNCISQPCSAASDCDAAAPFCVEGLCSETCTVDANCPGYGEPAEQRFCLSNACVSCREASDCGGTTPVCDANTCRACASHAECSSGLCGSDGACVSATQIAYVTPAGSPNTDCTMGMPCTLTRAAALTGLKYILVAAGSYSSPATIDIGGERWIIGTGSTRPRVTNAGTGPIFRVLPGSDTRWEHLELYGARNSGSTRPYGSSIDAFDSGAGSRMIALIDMLLTQYEYAGLDCSSCTAIIERSVFNNAPMSAGIWSYNATLTIDRSVFTGNQIGVYLYNGLHMITNSMFVRNNESGVELCRSNTLSARVEFSTIADNAVSAIKTCNDSAVVFQNDLIVRNPMLVSSSTLPSATYPGSIITSDANAVKFMSPDMQPYDYHVTAGSSAIDQALSSNVDHDFDGQPRPMGAAADVGADELQ